MTIFNPIFLQNTKRLQGYLIYFILLVRINTRKNLFFIKGLIMESERGRAEAWPLIVYILSSGGLSVSALRPM